METQFNNNLYHIAAAFGIGEVEDCEKEFYEGSNDFDEVANKFVDWMKLNAVGKLAEWKIVIRKKYLSLPYEPNFVSSELRKLPLIKGAKESFSHDEELNKATPNDGVTPPTF